MLKHFASRVDVGKASSWFALLTLAVAAVAQAREAPSTRRVDTVDHVFGLTISDPYRWMEGENNAEFNAWLKAQGAVSRTRLDALQTLGAWRKRLAAAAAAITMNYHPRQVGDRLFFRRVPAGKENMLMVREGDGREHVIYDPNSEPGSHLSNYGVSPDGSKVTVNIGHGGNEIGEVALFDVATGKRLPDTLQPVWSEFNPSWLPDCSGFFYTRLRDIKPGDADPLQGMGTYLHRLGEPRSRDRLAAQAGARDVLRIAVMDFPSVELTPGSEWALLEIGGAHANTRSCVAPRDDVVAGSAAWRCLVDDADGIQGRALHGDTLYLLQAKGAPNRRILAIDLRDPHATLSQATVVVPERAGVVLTDIGAAHDALYVKSMRRGLDHVERMDYATHMLHPVVMPGDGTIQLMQTDPRQDGAFLSLEGWTAPSKVYRYDVANRKLIDTGLGMLGAPAYPGIVAEEIEATSADGTRVPMSVLRPKRLPMDGSARAIVVGYGRYGISIQPSFDPIHLEWSRAGNVMAVCHVRGGGEKGDAWRIAGTGPNKQRGIEDFIACAQELARRGYSRPQRTAGFSASMGGILAGGAYTTAPAAWGAMMVQSGILNPVRLLAAKNGANQMAELGDPRTADGIRQLLAMDPYQHVRAGTKYPPLLLVTGAVDQRVAPWNSGKYGARVMAASPATSVWFRTDDQLGHFATNVNARALEMADIYAFADARLQTQPASRRPNP